MAVQTQYTVEEFDRLIQDPPNADRLLEYIGGEIVEVVSNNYSSLVAGNVLFSIKLYLRESGMQGYVTGEAGGYQVAGERYIPDVGFISKARQPEPSHDAYNPNPPELAVEVLSPTDKPNEMTIKVINYLSAGTTVWVIDPENKRAAIYTPGPKVRRVGMDGVLDGGDVLPGFKLTLTEIFPD
jgi:Uma2 family endonuclease